MMGTGVNIAARLESVAKPGAICMSQVVYDVVKSRLELDATYAGELSLKNIEESVVAYHVWPLGMRPQEHSSGEETTKAVVPLTITPINAALKALSEHPNSRRIKKLLYGTHQSAWENDSTVLEVVSLRLLLESLTERNDSLNDCRNSLYQIVSTLNRQEEYSQVAEVVLENLKALYTEPAADPGEIESIGGTFSGHQQEESSFLLKNSLDALHQDIADLLEQTPETIRVKKMLYCLCYDSWENDGDRIIAIPTVSLVTELYRQITTVQGLQDRLRTVLTRLNRRAKYAPIANLIFTECQILYPEGNSPIIMPGELPTEDSAGDNTQIHSSKSSSKRVSKEPSRRWLAPKPSDEAIAEAETDTPTLICSFSNSLTR